ncbi:MAG: hypothetical protein H0X25_03725 [Acidobacteriales bacterium]|nr:hypothetical protein [Terriglobales bacterium]
MVPFWERLRITSSGIGVGYARSPIGLGPYFNFSYDPAGTGNYYMIGIPVNEPFVYGVNPQGTALVGAQIGLVNVAFWLRKRYFSAPQPAFEVHSIETARSIACGIGHLEKA